MLFKQTSTKKTKDKSSSYLSLNLQTGKSDIQIDSTDLMPSFEKGCANLRYFTYRGVNLKEILLLRPKLGV